MHDDAIDLYVSVLQHSPDEHSGFMESTSMYRLHECSTNRDALVSSIEDHIDDDDDYCGYQIHRIRVIHPDQVAFLKSLKELSYWDSYIVIPFEIIGVYDEDTGECLVDEVVGLVSHLAHRECAVNTDTCSVIF